MQVQFLLKHLNAHGLIMRLFKEGSYIFAQLKRHSVPIKKNTGNYEIKNIPGEEKQNKILLQQKLVMITHH
jgi:hypothetical protein